MVKSIVDAYGGPQSIRRHQQQVLRTRGTITTFSLISAATNDYECQIVEKGSKVRVEMTMLGVPLVIGYDGTDSWNQYGDWVSPGSASTTQRMADELHHGLSALGGLLSPYTKIELLPKELIHGSMYDVFRVTAAGGTSDTFYADPYSHLIARIDYPGTDHELGTNTTLSVEYSNYKSTLGFMEPYRMVQMSGTRKKSETVIDEITVDNSVNDAYFHMPPESHLSRLQEGSVVIPFEYSGNQIIVKARINNSIDAAFIVDTGASQSVIDESLANALGPHPSSTISITAGARALPLAYTKISSLSLGSVTVNDIPVLIKNLSDLADHPSGLLGANILKRFLITIDFENNRIVLADPRNDSAREGATVVPTLSVFGGTALIVKGKLDDRLETNFLVDTGASFNNLPQTLAHRVYNGSLPAVGVIFGLDGQRINIGSIRCKSLQLASASIAHPVFTLTPDGTLPNGGLFNASGLGILGNPIWSQFRTTIDYRNERIVLEAQPNKDKFRQLNGQLDTIRQEYLRDKDVDRALTGYAGVLTAARTANLKEAEALAISRIAGCYADKYSATKESRFLDIAGKQYDKANKVANESYNKSVEGQVLAQWALMYLSAPRAMNDITAAQSLVSKALQKAPMEPNIFAAFGTTMLHAGKYSEAEKLLDRALVLDPANWQALWSKYKLYEEQSRPKELADVVAQLQYYYPSYPDVLALSTNHHSKSEIK